MPRNTWYFTTDAESNYAVCWDTDTDRWFVIAEGVVTETGPSNFEVEIYKPINQTFPPQRGERLFFQAKGPGPLQYGLFISAPIDIDDFESSL